MSARMDKNAPLYRALVDFLPFYLNKRGNLNVRALKDDVGRSHETVYQWLRDNKLSPTNVKRLVEIAHRPENLAELKRLGRKPPENSDFSQFVFAD